MAIKREPKRANEVRDYLHSWAAFLGEDTIQSQTTVGTGVTVDSSSIETGDQSVRFVLSGGVDDTTATVTQTIVSAGGRTETEVFTIRIGADEPVSLDEAKDYLRVRHDAEDTKIAGMIPRARQWVEDHTGTALVRRAFTERHLPGVYAGIRLFRGPLVSVDEVAYTDSQGASQTYVPLAFPPGTLIYPASGESWPAPGTNEQFLITYTAGCAEGECDDRLIGAMLTLIAGEYDAGYAYPDEAVKAAELCCGYVRAMVA